MIEPTAAPRTATTLAGESSASCCSNQERPTIMEPTFSRKISQEKLKKEQDVAERNFHSRDSPEPNMEVAMKNASIIPSQKDEVRSFPVQGKSSQMRRPLSPTEIKKLQEAFAKLHGRTKSFARPPASFGLRKLLRPQHFANEQSSLQSNFSGNQLLYYKKVQQLQKSAARKGHNEVRRGHSLAFHDKLIAKQFYRANGCRKPHEEVTNKQVTTMAAFPRSSRDSCYYAKSFPDGRLTSTPRTNGRKMKENVTLRDSKAVLPPPPPSSRFQESARPFAASFREPNPCTPCSSPTASSIDSESTQDANAHEVDSSLLLNVKDVPIARGPPGTGEEKENEFPFKEVKSTPVAKPQPSHLQISLEVQKEPVTLKSLKVALEPEDQRPENDQNSSASGSEEGTKFAKPAQDQPSVSGLQASLEGLAVALRRVSNRAKCAAFSFALKAEEEQDRTTSIVTGQVIAETQNERENALGKLETGPEESRRECVSKLVEPSPSSGIQNSLEGLSAALINEASKNFSKKKEQSASSDKRTGRAHTVSLGRKSTTKPRLNLRETKEDNFTRFCKEYFEKSAGSKRVLSTPSSGFIKSVNRLIIANKKASLLKETTTSGRKRSSKRRKRQKHNKKRHRKHLKNNASARSLPKQKKSKFSLEKVAVWEVINSNKMLEDAAKGSKTDPNKRSSLIKAEKALEVTSDILEMADSCLQVHIASLTANDNTNKRKQKENPVRNIVVQPLPAAKTSKTMDKDSVRETKARNTELSIEVQTALPHESTDKTSEEVACVSPSYRPPSLKEIKEAAQNIRNMFSSLFVTDAEKGEIVDPFVEELQTFETGYQEQSVCQPQNTSTLLPDVQETNQIHSLHQPEAAPHKNSKFLVVEDADQAISAYPPEAELKVGTSFQLAQVTDIQNRDQASSFQGSPNEILEGEILNRQILEGGGYKEAISQLQNAAVQKLATDINAVAQDPALQIDSCIGSKTQGSSVIDEANSMLHQSMNNHVAPVGEIHAVNGSTVPEMKISGQFNIRQSLSGLAFHVSGDVSTGDQRLLERIQVSGNVDIQRLLSGEGLNISTNLNIIPSISGGQSAFIQGEVLALEEETSIQSTKVLLEDVVVPNSIETSADEGLQQDQLLYLTKVPFVEDAHEGMAVARPSEVEYQVPEYSEASSLPTKEEFPVPGTTDVGTSVMNEDIHSNMQQSYDKLQASKLLAEEIEAAGEPLVVEHPKQLSTADTVTVTVSSVVSSPIGKEHMHVPTPLPEEVNLGYRDQIPSSSAVPVQGTVATDKPSQASTIEYTWESNAVQYSKPVSTAQEEFVTPDFASQESRYTTTELTRKTQEVVCSAEKLTKETLLRIYAPQKYSQRVDRVVMSRAAELIETGIFVVSDSGTVDGIVHPNSVSREDGSPDMCTFSSTFNQHDVLPAQYQRKIIRSAQEEGLNNIVTIAEPTRLVHAIPGDVSVRGQIIEDCEGDQIMLDAPKPTCGLSESHHQLANGHVTQTAPYHYNEPQRNVDVDMLSDGQESLMDIASGSNSQTSLMDCEDCTDQVPGHCCLFCKEIQRQKTSLSTSLMLEQPKPRMVSSFDGSNERDRIAMCGLENNAQKSFENQTQPVLSIEGKEIPYAGDGLGFQATVAAAGCSEQTSIFNVPSAIVQQGHLNSGVTQTLLSCSNNLHANENQGYIESHSPTSQGNCAVQDVSPFVEGHENTDVSAVTDESYCPNPLAQKTQAQNKDSALSIVATNTDSSLERAEGTEGLSPVAPSILDLCASIDIRKPLNEFLPAAKNLEDQKKHLASDKANTLVSDATLTNNSKAESLSSKTLQETVTSLDWDKATSLSKMNGSNETSRIDTKGNFIVENAPYLEEKFYSSDCHHLQFVQATSEQTTCTFAECSVVSNVSSSITDTDVIGPKEMENSLPKTSLEEQWSMTSNMDHMEASTAKQPLSSSTALPRVNEEETSVMDTRRKVIVPRKKVLLCTNLTERKVIPFDELFGEDRRPELQASSLSGKKRLREPNNEVYSDEESSTELKRRRKVRFSDEVQVCEIDNLPNLVHSGRFVAKPAFPRKGILKTPKSRMKKG